MNRILAEAVGTALLLATIVGSGIMGERLANGNAAIALLANSVATGASLYALITMFGHLSGAHFNPVVTLTAWIDRTLTARTAFAYVFAQAAGAVFGVLAAHAMFQLPLIMTSTRERTGTSQWISEVVATFGLILAIRLTVRFHDERIAAVVACYITAAYWFTSSTSFANPAVTAARSMTDTFSGIRPADAPWFMVAQLIGGLLAWTLTRQRRRMLEPTDR